MPTYEYECEDCGYFFNKFQGIMEDPIKSCEKCGGKVKKLIGSGAGIIFKGKGFYQTDYKSTKKPCDATSEKSSSCENIGSCPCKE